MPIKTAAYNKFCNLFFSLGKNEVLTLHVNHLVDKLQCNPFITHLIIILHHLAQSVLFLATDASLTANLGVTSSTPARFHIFEEIDREIIISKVILLPSAE